MAVVTQVLLLRKPDSYTVAIYEFRGSRRWRRGGAGERLGEGGGGEGRREDPCTSIATGQKSLERHGNNWQPS